MRDCSRRSHYALATPTFPGRHSLERDKALQRHSHAIDCNAAPQIGSQHLLAALGDGWLLPPSNVATGKCIFKNRPDLKMNPQVSLPCHCSVKMIHVVILILKALRRTRGTAEHKREGEKHTKHYETIIA